MHTGQNAWIFCKRIQAKLLGFSEHHPGKKILMPLIEVQHIASQSQSETLNLNN